LQAAATDGAGNAVDAVTLNYESFISVVIDFVIIAFAIFMVVKAMNSAKARMEKEEEEKPADPPKPSDEVVLLTEIRDALKSS
jgi:large conductance mechanosensitive channel